MRVRLKTNAFAKRVQRWRVYTPGFCQGDKELLKPDTLDNRPLPLRAPSWGSVESQSLAAPPGPPSLGRQQPPLHLLSLGGPAPPAAPDPLLGGGRAPRAAPAPELVRMECDDVGTAAAQYFRHAHLAAMMGEACGA